MINFQDMQKAWQEQFSHPMTVVYLFICSILLIFIFCISN